MLGNDLQPGDIIRDATRSTIRFPIRLLTVTLLVMMIAFMFGKEYDEQKRIYGEGVKRFVAALKEQVNTAVIAERTLVLLSGVAACIIFFIALAAWLA